MIAIFFSQIRSQALYCATGAPTGGLQIDSQQQLTGIAQDDFRSAKRRAFSKSILAIGKTGRPGVRS